MRRFFFLRFVSAFLILTLAVPCPAHALRAEGPTSSKVAAGLEEALGSKAADPPKKSKIDVRTKELSVKDTVLTVQPLSPDDLLNYREDLWELLKLIPTDIPHDETIIDEMRQGKWYDRDLSFAVWDKMSNRPIALATLMISTDPRYKLGTAVILENFAVHPDFQGTPATSWLLHRAFSNAHALLSRLHKGGPLYAHLLTMKGGRPDKLGSERAERFYTKMGGAVKTRIPVGWEVKAGEFEGHVFKNPHLEFEFALPGCLATIEQEFQKKLSSGLEETQAVEVLQWSMEDLREVLRKRGLLRLGQTDDQAAELALKMTLEERFKTRPTKPILLRVLPSNQTQARSLEEIGLQPLVSREDIVSRLELSAYEDHAISRIRLEQEGEHQHLSVPLSKPLKIPGTGQSLVEVRISSGDRRFDQLPEVSRLVQELRERKASASDKRDFLQELPGRLRNGKLRLSHLPAFPLGLREEADVETFARRVQLDPSHSNLLVSEGKAQEAREREERSAKAKPRESLPAEPPKKDKPPAADQESVAQARELARKIAPEAAHALERLLKTLALAASWAGMPPNSKEVEALGEEMRRALEPEQVVRNHVRKGRAPNEEEAKRQLALLEKQLRERMRRLYKTKSRDEVVASFLSQIQRMATEKNWASYWWLDPDVEVPVPEAVTELYLVDPPELDEAATAVLLEATRLLQEALVHHPPEDPKSLLFLRKLQLSGVSYLASKKKLPTELADAFVRDPGTYQGELWLVRQNFWYQKMRTQKISENHTGPPGLVQRAPRKGRVENSSHEIDFGTPGQLSRSSLKKMLLTKMKLVQQPVVSAPRTNGEPAGPTYDDHTRAFILLEVASQPGHFSKPGKLEDERKSFLRVMWIRVSELQRALKQPEPTFKDAYQRGRPFLEAIQIPEEVRRDVLLEDPAAVINLSAIMLEVMARIAQKLSSDFPLEEGLEGSRVLRRELTWRYPAYRPWWPGLAAAGKGQPSAGPSAELGAGLPQKGAPVYGPHEGGPKTSGLEETEGKPKSTEEWFQAGLEFLQEKDFPSAAIAFRAVTDLDPGLGEAWSNLAIALLEQGLLEEALAASQKAVIHLPNCAACWLILGNIHRNAGRLSKAINAYGTALELDPKLSQAHSQLGLTYHRMAVLILGRQPPPDSAESETAKEWLHLAKEAYKAAIGLNPDDPLTLNNLGNVFLSLGDPASAEENLRGAVMADPEYLNPWINLGHLYRETGRFSDAAKALCEVLKLKPEDFDAWDLFLKMRLDSRGQGLERIGRLHLIWHSILRFSRAAKSPEEMPELARRLEDVKNHGFLPSDVPFILGIPGGSPERMWSLFFEKKAIRKRFLALGGILIAMDGAWRTNADAGRSLSPDERIRQLTEDTTRGLGELHTETGLPFLDLDGDPELMDVIARTLQFLLSPPPEAGLEEKIERFGELVRQAGKILDGQTKQGLLKPKIQQIQEERFFIEGGIAYLPHRQGKAVVIGDLHGDLEALQRTLKMVRKETGYDPKTNKNSAAPVYLVFVGDYQDAGSQSLEVLLTVLDLYAEDPNHVILLGGNHERGRAQYWSPDVRAEGPDSHWFFKDINKIVGRKKGGTLYDRWHRLCLKMPVLAVASQGLVVAHAGSSNTVLEGPGIAEKYGEKLDPRKGLLGIAQSRDLQDQISWNPMPSPKTEEALQQAQQAPDRRNDAFRRLNPRRQKRGFWTGREGFDVFMEAIGGKVMARGHDRLAPWWVTLFNGRVITLIGTHHQSPHYGYRKDQITARFAVFDLAKSYDRVDPGEVLRFPWGKPSAKSGLEETQELIDRLANSEEPITEADVRELNGHYQEPSSPTYREAMTLPPNAEHEAAGGFRPEAPIAEQMSDFLKWLNTAAGSRQDPRVYPSLGQSIPDRKPWNLDWNDPATHAAMAHWLFHQVIHPYDDGNGHTGWALLNILRRRAGLPPVRFLAEREAGYLKTFRLNRDPFPYLQFMEEPTGMQAEGGLEEGMRKWRPELTRRVRQTARAWKRRGWLRSTRAFTQPVVEAARYAEIGLQKSQGKMGGRQRIWEKRLRTVMAFSRFLQALEADSPSQSPARILEGFSRGRSGEWIEFPGSEGEAFRVRVGIRRRTNRGVGPRRVVPLISMNFEEGSASDGPFRPIGSVRIGTDEDGGWERPLVHLDLSDPVRGGRQRNWFSHGEMALAWSNSLRAGRIHEAFGGFLNKLIRHIEALPRKTAAGLEEGEEVQKKFKETLLRLNPAWRPFINPLGPEQLKDLMAQPSRASRWLGPLWGGMGGRKKERMEAELQEAKGVADRYAQWLRREKQRRSSPEGIRRAIEEVSHRIFQLEPPDLRASVGEVTATMTGDPQFSGLRYIPMRRMVQALPVLSETLGLVPGPGRRFLEIGAGPGGGMGLVAALKGMEVFLVETDQPFDVNLGEMREHFQRMDLTSETLDQMTAKGGVAKVNPLEKLEKTLAPHREAIKAANGSVTVIPGDFSRPEVQKKVIEAGPFSIIVATDVVDPAGGQFRASLGATTTGEPSAARAILEGLAKVASASSERGRLYVSFVGSEMGLLGSKVQETYQTLEELLRAEGLPADRFEMAPSPSSGGVLRARIYRLDGTPTEGSFQSLSEVMGAGLEEKPEWVQGIRAAQKLGKVAVLFDLELLAELGEDEFALRMMLVELGGILRNTLAWPKESKLRLDLSSEADEYVGEQGWEVIRVVRDSTRGEDEEALTVASLPGIVAEALQALALGGEIFPVVVGVYRAGLKEKTLPEVLSDMAKQFA
ncbi:MAG: tetratricopeptide repeat protein [Candidatus Omnitrophica bacterium]|nr:tetratricopeptide repeat protein [Candidatus Omnitrophota bacterium]